MIRPLGEQIIIRTLPPEQVGLIVIPDSAKRITQQGEGPTRNMAGDLQYINRVLFERCVDCLETACEGPVKGPVLEAMRDIAARARRSVLPKEAPGIDPSGSTPVNFVEAEVIAVGPGKRIKGDRTIIRDMAAALALFVKQKTSGRVRVDPTLEDLQELLRRAQQQHEIIPPVVKPGDRILYHPAVQRFDRRIDGALIGDERPGEYFIIREGSVLAILDREETGEAAA